MKTRRLITNGVKPGKLRKMHFIYVTLGTLQPWQNIQNHYQLFMLSVCKVFIQNQDKSSKHFKKGRKGRYRIKPKQRTVRIDL